VLGSFDR